MPAIAASNVSVTIAPVFDQWIDGGGMRHVNGTLTFGDGALTYPTGGVPLPAIGVFGFTTTCRGFEVYGVNGLTTDYYVQYSPASHKLLMYEEEAAAAGGPLLECDTAEAPAARTYSFHAWGY